MTICVTESYISHLFPVAKAGVPGKRNPSPNTSPRCPPQVWHLTSAPASWYWILDTFSISTLDISGLDVLIIGAAKLRVNGVRTKKWLRSHVDHKKAHAHIQTSITLATRFQSGTFLLNWIMVYHNPHTQINQFYLLLRVSMSMVIQSHLAAR